jgi:hypothetical protein
MGRSALCRGSAWGHHRATILLISLIALLLSACAPNDAVSPDESDTTAASPPSHESTLTNWPKQVENFRFRWSAAEGVDLMTGPAVALRAYVESYRLVGMVGGDMSVVYPGFLHATRRTRARPRREVISSSCSTSGRGRAPNSKRTDGPIEVRGTAPLSVWGAPCLTMPRLARRCRRVSIPPRRHTGSPFPDGPNRRSDRAIRPKLPHISPPHRP